MNVTDVHDRWESRSGAYSPEYYAYYGPNATSEAIRRTLARFVDPDATVLELGCSSGRHLAHLHDHGYENLFGIDINETAFDVMQRHSPDLFAAGTFYCCPIERLARSVSADRFDVVYSVETLQHVHPDNEWVFDELARVAGTTLLTAENEGQRPTRDESSSTPPADSSASEIRHVDGVPLYVRDWTQVFTDRGLHPAECEQTELERHTLRAFRVDDAPKPPESDR
ncbi:class I SAM-dependent methyltransferase [Natrialba sp. PRR66]|uniref:class I SAM-dependent methyltransferase n=1 Tax=Natrialba sp. PRR66 TaxID=3098146 RepID=UPI002B1D7FDB|nr:class I SAM-dependent methyltransferase [Natrialba sp. PRR66]